jgi:hypothetical protein
MRGINVYHDGVSVTEMYGTPRDRQGKDSGEKTSLRKCIQPVVVVSKE